jgi:flagellar protein FlgJ
MTALSIDGQVGLATATAMANSASASRGNAKLSPTARAHEQAQDFEAVFLGTMFNHMFTAADGDGPLGNTQGTGPWRSFLTDAFAKSVAKSGGVGIADQVYRSLISHQEASAGQAPHAR